MEGVDFAAEPQNELPPRQDASDDLPDFDGVEETADLAAGEQEREAAQEQPAQQPAQEVEAPTPAPQAAQAIVIPDVLVEVNAEPITRDESPRQARAKSVAAPVRDEVPPAQPKSMPAARVEPQRVQLPQAGEEALATRLHLMRALQGYLKTQDEHNALLDQITEPMAQVRLKVAATRSNVRRMIRGDSEDLWNNLWHASLAGKRQATETVETLVSQLKNDFFRAEEAEANIWAAIEALQSVLEWMTPSWKLVQKAASKTRHKEAWNALLHAAELPAKVQTAYRKRQRDQINATLAREADNEWQKSKSGRHAWTWNSKWQKQDDEDDSWGDWPRDSKAESSTSRASTWSSKDDRNHQHERWRTSDARSSQWKDETWQDDRQWKHWKDDDEEWEPMDWADMKKTMEERHELEARQHMQFQHTADAVIQEDMAAWQAFGARHDVEHIAAVARKEIARALERLLPAEASNDDDDEAMPDAPADLPLHATWQRLGAADLKDQNEAKQAQVKAARSVEVAHVPPQPPVVAPWRQANAEQWPPEPPAPIYTSYRPRLPCACG
eukprot:6467276-Amphidinium_carterae.1